MSASRADSRVTITLFVGSYLPETISAGALYGTLADAFASLGFRVEVMTLNRRRDVPTEEDDGRIAVRRVGWHRNRATKLVRLLGHTRSMMAVFFQTLIQNASGPLIVYSPPLHLAALVVLAGKLRRRSVVLHVQDLHPLVLRELSVVTRAWEYRVYELVEMAAYSLCDVALVYSDRNEQHVRGVRPETVVRQVRNWSTVAVRAPAQAKAVPSTHPVQFVYAGAMGPAQGLTVLASAMAQATDARAKLDLVGDGPSRAEVEQLAAALPAVRVRDFVDPVAYQAIIEAADVGVVCLAANTPLATIPGKLSNLLAVGLPILLVANPIGDAAKLALEAGGVVIADPTRPGEVAASIDFLASDANARAEMAQANAAFAALELRASHAARDILKLLNL